ncbi:hypothetical protein D6855_02850 [Butyrivibrio sp. CB08]|uniref:polysaccharide biosynthesis C-terminal domain-containing protein n=1 Tax=Butyrivibrio sp. CB08 TaxID=2364879 RepID=UPI000EAA832B|nr:polysaccharide biosynthesis C-terminal domain-containing protein [Butyrivibrio sp. CB08]RKM62372.1 hypothetical protein D6855_02850 [Butyrivibrio sp. CB08]
MRTYAEDKRIRPDILTAAVYVAASIILIFLIVSEKIFGDKGTYFVAGPFSIFVLFYLGLVLSVQKAVYIMVRLRARRSQYLNAEANMQRSMRIFSVAGVISGVLLICACFPISIRLFGTERGYIQIIIAGASVLLLGIQGVLRGYLQGIGYTKPIVIADILVAVVSLVSGIIISEVLFTYGTKVNDLFHVDEFSAVYGSSGMMAGVFIGSLVGFVQIVISYNLRKNEIASFVKSGAPRYLDNKNDVIAGIRPIMLLYCAPAFVSLFDQCFYSIYMRKAHEDIDFKTIYGMVFGRVEVLVAFIVIICCIPFIKSLNRIMARVERDEHEGSRERFRGFMRFSNMLFIPAAVFVFAVSDSLMTAVFGKSTELANGLLMLGSTLIYFGGFMVMFSWLINHMGKSVLTMLNVGICLAAHIALMVLFVPVLKLGAHGILLAVLVSMIVYDLLNLLEISKILSNRQEYVKTFLMPLLSAAVAGVVAFLLNMLLAGLIGEILTLIVCLILFWITYMIVMIFSRGIRAHELRKVFLGQLFYGVARMIQTEEQYEGYN